MTACSRSVRSLLLGLAVAVASALPPDTVRGAQAGTQGLGHQDGMTPGLPGGGVQLQLRESVTLPAVGLAEIWPGATSAIDMGTWQSSGNPISRLGVATVPEVQRTAGLLWRLRVHRSLPDPLIDYRITAASGAPASFSSVAVPTSLMPVRTVPIGPIFVGRQGNRRVFEGGAEFFLDLGATRAAGAYGGTLTITFTNL